MARKATGKVIEPDGKQKSYALRFTAYGKRRFVTLGTPEEGWTPERAADELRYVLDRVKRGHWTPPVKVATPAVKRVVAVPNFHEFASSWMLDREPELAARTVEDYKWALCGHLLPFFAKHALDEITIQEVDRYKAMKAREGCLSNNSINKTLTRLSQVLETAVEYDLLPSNPAAGRRRRLRASKPSRPHVEPEQLMALLTAAESLRGSYQPLARPLLATLAGTGLRIGEALDLQWRDVNLGARTLRVRRSKTGAGVREVDLTPAVAEELGTLKSSPGRGAAGDPVFASLHPGRRDRRSPTGLDRHRVRSRILTPAIAAANGILEGKGIEPIADTTLHGLRRTYASLRFASGDDAVYVAQQLGHTSGRFSLEVYAKATKRRNRLTGETRSAFDQAIEWAEIGRMSGYPRSDELDANPTNSGGTAWTKGF